MRDKLVVNEKYFEEYASEMKMLMQKSKDRIINGSLADENIPGAKFRYFLNSLENLIAKANLLIL